MMFGKTKKLEQELSERGGVVASGAVISAQTLWTSGSNYDNGPYTIGSNKHVKVKLRVEPEGEPVFEAAFKQTFSGRAPMEREPVKVIYDPENHSRIAITALLGFAPNLDERRRDREELVAKILRGELSPTGKPYVRPAVAEEVAKVAALRDQGSLSEDEFHAQIAALFAAS